MSAGDWNAVWALIGMAVGGLIVIVTVWVNGK